MNTRFRSCREALAFIVTWILGATASADTWELAYGQTKPPSDPQRSSAYCFLWLERGGATSSSASSDGITLFVSTSSIVRRQEAGHPEPYQPVMQLSGNPLKGEKREALDSHLGGRVTVTRGRRDATGLFHVSSQTIAMSGFEFRIRYRVDIGSAHDGWVSPFGHIWIDDESNPDHTIVDFDRSRISYQWWDYPQELFGTDERRSLLVRHAGLVTRGVAITNPLDYFDSFHRMNVQYTFVNGRTAMRYLNRCVDLHRDAGRFDNIDGASADAEQDALWTQNQLNGSRQIMQGAQQ